METRLAAAAVIRFNLTAGQTAWDAGVVGSAGVITGTNVKAITTLREGACYVRVTGGALTPGLINDVNEVLATTMVGITIGSNRTDIGTAMDFTAGGLGFTVADPAVGTAYTQLASGGPRFRPFCPLLVPDQATITATFDRMTFGTATTVSVSGLAVVAYLVLAGARVGGTDATDKVVDKAVATQIIPAAVFPAGGRC